MATIESLLDDQGKGILTDDLYRIFVANGCKPECHICDRKLRVGESIHLKAFFVKTSGQQMLTGGPAQIISDFDLEDDEAVPQVDFRGKTTSSIDVMICAKCSQSNRPLPRDEADKLLAVAHVHGMIEDAKPEQAPSMGRIGPQTYSYHRSGLSMRSGGCMIVRQHGHPLKIIGSEQSD